MAGWLLEPVEGDPNSTAVTLLLEVDMKGIPQMALNKALKEQGKQIKPLKGAIMRYLKENPEPPLL